MLPPRWADLCIAKNPTTMNTTPTETLRFTTTGITCGGCANSATNILKRLPGVVAVRVDAAAGTAEVEMERGAVDLDALLIALKPAGYGLIPKAA
ncbi:MAG: heavy-metal-associated domain-containing protein [Flavobacteriales bacterium]|nr:heavy-metal-associated domain-containing protein [Flavobacteriales bacterium]